MRFAGYRAHSCSRTSSFSNADQELIAELLDRLVSLKGELEETDRKLSDPDWIVRVHNGPLSVRLAFFRSADGLWIASDELVFRARQSDLSWLVKPAKAWRDLRLTYYERGEVRRVEIADGTGRTFVYRRQPDAQGGLDRWFHHDRALKDTHLLSGLQWDLHRLRGRAIVDELTTLECGEQCARIKMIDGRDKVLVDVALDRRQRRVDSAQQRTCDGDRSASRRELAVHCVELNQAT